MNSFTKQEFNTDFDHTSEVIKMFGDLGYTPEHVEQSTTNGLSIYVTLIAKVINEGRLYSEMDVYGDSTVITVRVSDHFSNLETICGGVSRNKMTLSAFNKLIETGAIKGSK